MAIKKLTVLLLLLGNLAAGVGIAHGRVYLTPKEALELAFPGADKIIKKKVWLDKKARAAIGEAAGQQIDDLSFQFYVGMAGEKVLGYMAIDDVIGKAEPITYMIVFTPEGVVKRVEIMVYRESQGGEVRYRAFMKQYEGKTVNDPLRVGDDIRNISGATLSAFSITAGMKKMLAIFQYSFLGGTSPSEER
ncbi:MAG: FMN-binding protein [Candidatus Binatia bacterium]